MRNITTEISKLIGNKEVIAHGRLTGDCIHDLEVDMDYRNCGFATEIINKLILYGGKRLWVKADNNEAISLYRKLGFLVSREEDGYYEMQLR